jgi:hypothetical protein
MPRRPTHPNLFVILARRAHVGVILRRGPATWTQVTTWNTRNDTFESGQWFHGRLYERRCDLSPSGDKLIYFVAKHHLQRVDPTYTRTWTAISRPPYLTALALSPNGGTTYHGGGLFAGENEVQLNAVDHRWSNPERGEAAPAHPKHKPPRQVRVSPMAFTSGDQLLPKRLVRDGWTLVTPGDVDRDTLPYFNGRFVREMKYRRLELAVGYHQMDYLLFEKQKGRWVEQPFEGVGWADFDQDGRLVFAKEGKLFAAPQVGRTDEPALLLDLNGRRPERLVAPPLARRW